MKDIRQRHRSDMLFYCFLFIICSKVNNLKSQKTKLNVVDPNPISNLGSEADSSIPFPKSNIKQTALINEASNFDFFKSFLTKIIKNESIKEKMLKTDNPVAVTEGSSGNLSKEAFRKEKSKKLNFNSETVKIAEIPKCDLDSCARENGICISDSQCKCNYGNINYLNGQSSNKLCDYKLSFQLYALILEIFLPFGFGHIYCKRYLIGFIKFLVLFLIPFIAYLINRKLVENKSDFSRITKVNKECRNERFYFINIIKFVYFLISMSHFGIFFIWFAFDLVIFSANKHKDGFGFDLIPI